MDDLKNSGNSEISYTFLSNDSSRHRCTLKELCKSKTLFVSAAVLIILTPLCIWYRHRYNDLEYDTENGKVLPQLVERAIYYNTNAAQSNISFRLVCYYTFPSPTDTDALMPEKIDPFLCTHLNVGFAQVVNNSLYLTDYELSIFNATTALKEKNPELKLLVSIGGVRNNSGFPTMVLNHANRKNFIKSVDNFIRQYKCDGIDLDWEFPNKVPSRDNKQRMHFTQLLYELRKEINRQHKHKFILSVAVAAPKFIIDLSYDVTYMNNYVDFVNVMTYDFHFYTKFTPFTGFNAPLFSSENRDINNSVNYWVESGMDKGKINVGLPTYGHTFELFNVNNNGLGAPVRGYGHLGSSGFADYNKICLFLLNNYNVNVIFDYAAKSPYAFKYSEWVSFDDETSLLYKAQYIVNSKFGGGMIFSLNADDHIGQCKNHDSYQSFPLTNQIKSILSQL